MPDDVPLLHPRRQLSTIGLAVLPTLPGLLLRPTGTHTSQALFGLALFGLAIVGPARFVGAFPVPRRRASVIAVAILSNLNISVREALTLFALFWAQFIVGARVPESLRGVELVALSVVYLVLVAVVILRRRRTLGGLFRDGMRTSYEELAPAG